ncbi:MAG: NAD+ kinase [Granulosicoccus sp.]|jgi:NAD+ kinase
MKIAVHGRARNERSRGFICDLIPHLAEACDTLLISEDLKLIIGGQIPNNATILKSSQLSAQAPDIFVSLGGDGTILETTGLIGRTGIPILGINTGRLGYLSSAGHDNATETLHLLSQGHYDLEARRLLEIELPNNPFGGQNFSLNEFAIHKSESASMITVHVEVDGVFLNSYWADGLIVATPTGSTGYSLSCGGPIVASDSNNIILTPIAPHNLAVRPLVMNDGIRLKLRTDTNEEPFRISGDSRSHIVQPGTELEIKLADFTVNFIRMKGQNHFSTLRSKLMWGHDRRN